jgi:integrase
VIGSPKSEAGHRKVPLVAPVMNTLREWKLACPRVDATDESPGRLWLVFPNGEGRPESHSNIVNRGLVPIQIAAGVCDPALDPTGKVTVSEDGKPVMKPRYGMHSLRHFFASWVIERGFTAKRVQDLMGHSSVQMTFDTYGHLFPSAEDDHAKFAAGVAAMGVVQ